MSANPEQLLPCPLPTCGGSPTLTELRYSNTGSVYGYLAKCAACGLELRREPAGWPVGYQFKTMCDARDEVVRLWNTRARPEQPTCNWASDPNGFWRTQCGGSWAFTNDGDPRENNMKFCHNCGREIATGKEVQEQPTDTERLVKAARQLRKYIGLAEFQEPPHKGSCGPESCCDGICQDNAWAAEKNAAIAKFDSVLAAMKPTESEAGK